MTGVDVINLIAATAAPLLPSGFELVKDQNRDWTPAAGKVKMWVEPGNWRQETLNSSSGSRTLKVTFAAFVAEDIGMGPVTNFTDALAHGITGPFRFGRVFQSAPGSLDYLNSRAPSQSWTEGKDARAHPGLFASCALVTLDQYARAAAAA